jgi:acetyl esterase/lipase
MFTNTLRHSFTALVIWTAVLLMFLALGACSSPRASPPEKLAAVPTAPPSTATHSPTPLPQPNTPTPAASRKPGPSKLQLFPNIPDTGSGRAAVQPSPWDVQIFPNIPKTRSVRVATVDPGPYEVQLFPDIPYTSSGKLDVYAPSQPGEWPVVVAYRGGIGTNKEYLSILAKIVASYGLVVFVPNYRIVVSPSWRLISPDLGKGAEDAACAIRFARKYAVEYGGVPDRITGAGNSGGAWVAALMGLAGDDFAGDCLVKGGSGYLDGIVALEGPYNMVAFSQTLMNLDRAPQKFWEYMSPLFYPDKVPPRPGVKYHILVSEIPLSNGIREDTEAFYQALLDAGHQTQLTYLNNIPSTEFDQPLPETVRAILDMAWGEEGVGEP